MVVGVAGDPAADEAPVPPQSSRARSGADRAAASPSIPAPDSATLEERMTVIRFPQERCSWPDPAVYSQPATILILPVVRVERCSFAELVRRSYEASERDA